MKTTRLAKLAALTQGAALLGTLGTGCDKSVQSEPTQPPMINATATPPAADSAQLGADDAGVARRRFPILNAPPGRFQGDGNDAGK
jgi:hypothetical protein